MTTLNPIACVGCNIDLYPNLISPKACFHVHCMACMTEWLSKGQDCPIDRERITSIDDCSPLKTYLDTFAQHVQKNNQRVQEELKKIGTKDISKECPACYEEFDPIYFHDGMVGFWHEKCLKEQVAEPELPLLYPQHIVKVAQALSPKVEPPPEKPISWSWNGSFIKGVVVTLAVLSFCAFIINRLSPRSGNPFLFVLGFPFWIVEKFLLTIVAVLKLILTEEQ